ncbi:MAG: hypothetical protein ABIF85_02635 [Nanoarchaeota archaeon]
MDETSLKDTMCKYFWVTDMGRKESLKILAETNEKSFDVAHSSNDFLDTKAYNLTGALGLIITAWFFSLNYLINNGASVAVKCTEITPQIIVCMKEIIIFLSFISMGFYLAAFKNLTEIYRGKGFVRIAFNDKNVETYGNKTESEVYEMLATVMGRHLPVLRDINDKKATLMNYAISNIQKGVLFTFLIITIILLRL